MWLTQAIFIFGQLMSSPYRMYCVYSVQLSRPNRSYLTRNVRTKLFCQATNNKRVLTLVSMRNENKMDAHMKIERRTQIVLLCLILSSQTSSIHRIVHEIMELWRTLKRSTNNAWTKFHSPREKKPTVSLLPHISNLFDLIERENVCQPFFHRTPSSEKWNSW